MKVKYKYINNLKTAYFDEGKGKPILIIQGWLLSKECFIPLVNNLKSNYRVIVPDMPGFGDSEGFERDHTFENYLHFLKEFVNKLGLKKVVLFGNSLGGTFTNLFSINYPEKVDKIIMRAPLYYKKQFSIKYRNKFSKTLLKGFSKYAPGRSVLARFIKRKMLKHISKNSDLLKNKSGLVSREEIVNSIKRNFYEKTYKPAARDLIFEAMEVDLRKDIKNINKKTLIIWGDEDELLSNYWGENLNNLLNKSVYIEIKGSKHSVLSDDETIVAEKIKEFLNES